MKRYWLMAVSLVLLLTLLLSPCAPLTAALAEEMSETQETAAPQFDTQIFLLPKMNRDYVNKDAEQQFERFLQDLLLLLPQNKTAQVVLFPASGDEVTLLTESDELTAALKMPYEIKDTAYWLNKIESEYASSAKQNIVIAIESGNVKSTIEDSWGPLKQLAGNGLEVYLIGLQTKRNEEAGKALASWISNGRMSSAVANQTVTAADRLHFTWIQDYSCMLEILQPLVSQLTGLTFESAQANEYGVFTFHPYAGLTEKIVVLLENKAPEDFLSITNGTVNAVPHELTGTGNLLSVIAITEDTDIVKVAGGSKASGLFWAPVYDEQNGLTLAFGNSDNQTRFERNESGSFYAAVPGLDQEQLAQAMERYGAVCHMMDAATGRVLQTMVYDADSQVFRADYVFSESSESLQLYAQIQLNDVAGTRLVSEPYTIVITNTAPEITAQSEPVYWIGDPWEEKASHLIIPLSYSDHENDRVELSVVEPSTPLLPGLGKVQLSDDQSQLLIELNEAPQTAKAFTVRIAAHDGELSSDACEIRFILYDLTQELQKLETEVAAELPDGHSVSKYTDFRVSANVRFSDEMPELLKQKLTEKMDEHYTCTLLVEGPQGVTERLAMEKAEDWFATVNLQQSGAYSIKALLSTEQEELGIESEPQKIVVAGKTPVLSSGDFPAEMDGMMAQSEESAEEFWQMTGLIPSRLFKDEDGDEISISVSARLLNPKEGQEPLSLHTQAVGDQEAALRFTAAGLYEISIVASDIDGEGDSITSVLRITSARSQMLQYALLGAAALLALVLLILIIVSLAKHSFKGKIIEVTVRSTHWTKKTVVYADAWKKTVQPISVLLTSAACPPDSMLYAALEGCMIRPCRQGVMLLKADKLGLEKKTRITANESVSFQADQYEIELKITLD